MEIDQRIKSVKEWLILNSGISPYIIGYALKQWTKGTYERYPGYYLISFCGGRITKSGAEAQFLADQNEYHKSFEKVINNRDILDKVYKDFLKDEKDFKDFIEDIQREGEEYLHNNFNNFIKVYDAEYISAVVIDGVLVYGETFFNEMLKKYPDQEKSLRILIEPYGETFLNRYRQELFKLALSCNRDGHTSLEDILTDSKIVKGLTKIQKSFHWIQNNYKNVSALSIEFFAQQLLEILKDIKLNPKENLEELENYAKVHQKECEDIKIKNILDPEDYEKILWLGKIAWWVDRRKEYNLIANHYLGAHLEWLCDKYNLKYDDASLLLPWELDKIVEGNKNIDDFNINGRKEECIYFYDILGQEKMYYGEEAEKLWEKINPKIENLKDTKEIKGTVAQKGFVKGIVRVVMDAHNPGEFNEGDILVTGMTRPDFLSLMKKAAAFVTDEGGVTCHAAIVARELKKPCIIGTKFASKVLKSGDTVEVDANNGVIKIIK
jgi:pyruvate,water dikinase